MAVITEHRLILAGLRSGDAAATWGQRAIWHRIRTAGLPAHTFNTTQRIPVPAGLPTAAVLDALGRIVGRYDALRTRYVGDEPADLRQHLPARDELVVGVCEAGEQDPAALVPAFSERLAGSTFDPTVDIGIRAVVLTGRGAPHTVLTTMSHQAVDLSSARIVVEELGALLAARAAGRAAPEPPPARQPLEQAGYESSAEGARAGAKALRYWRTQLESVAATLFPVTYPPREIRFWRGTLRSTAVAMAADTLAIRHRTSTSTILLAAHGVALGQVTSLAAQPVLLVAENRSAALLRYAVGSLIQPVLATVDLTGPTFADVVRQAWSAVVVAVRNGQYDPTCLGMLEQEVRLRRAVVPDLGCHFNDLRTRASRAAAAATAGTIRTACADTTFRWLEPVPSEGGQCVLEVLARDGAVELMLLADTSVLPPERIRTVLYEIERLLVAEAAGP